MKLLPSKIVLVVLDVQASSSPLFIQTRCCSVKCAVSLFIISAWSRQSVRWMRIKRTGVVAAASSAVFAVARTDIPKLVKLSLLFLIFLCCIIQGHFTMTYILIETINEEQ